MALTGQWMTRRVKECGNNSADIKLLLGSSFVPKGAMLKILFQRNAFQRPKRVEALESPTRSVGLSGYGRRMPTLWSQASDHTPRSTGLNRSGLVLRVCLIFSL